jgi:predicted enzyme related to lactoylglutathione lyase
MVTHLFKIISNFKKRKHIMSNSVVHFEILGKDAAKTQNFYSRLFGWKIDANNPMQYGLVEAGPGGIGGGISAMPDGKPPMAKTVIPGMVTYAMFLDPDGIPMGLVLNEMPK